MMMRATSLAALLLCTACRTGSLGSCESDAQCPSGATCDPSAKVCLITAATCTPACASGTTCVGGSCVAASCNPGCDQSHVCDPATATCIPAATGNAVITLQFDGRTRLFGVGQTASVT